MAQKQIFLGQILAKPPGSHGLAGESRAEPPYNKFQEMNFNYHIFHKWHEW